MLIDVTATHNEFDHNDNKLKANDQIQQYMTIDHKNQITLHTTSNNTRTKDNNNITIKYTRIGTKITIACTIITCTIRIACQLPVEWFFLVNKHIVVQMDLVFYNVIVIHFLHQHLLLLMIALIIQQLIQIILSQLLIFVTVLIVIDIAIKIQLFILTGCMFYHWRRVLLLLFLLSLKTIKSMDIGLIQLNYNLIQVFICLCAFNCIITSIHCLEQLLFTINHANNKMEFFLVFLGIFLVVFYITQHGYERNNGSRKATNASLKKMKIQKKACDFGDCCVTVEPYASATLGFSVGIN